MPNKFLRDISKTTALKFILLIGAISFLADVTYEGARSITGPYLQLLGASGAVVGFVAGFGELIGYGLRLGSGYLADKTARYWTITVIGYVCNLLAVPLLALAGSWQIAAILIVCERAGKAIRTPARDAMLSHACQKVGSGWGFGLHEAMDQAGAMLGPLIISAILYFNGSYRMSFAVLLIPAMFALLVLFVALKLYPRPQELEIAKPSFSTEGIRSTYWLYLAGAALLAAGYADFALIAYHFAKTSLLHSVWIPVSYAMAMGISAISALVFGHLYDRYGYVILMSVTALAAFFAPLIFLGNHYWVFVGMALWGLGMGTQSSLMKAIIADLVPMQKRGSGYGIFNAGYGVAWFLGSALLGVLYDVSLYGLIIFSVLIQLAALPLFFLVGKRMKKLAIW